MYLLPPKSKWATPECMHNAELGLLGITSGQLGNKSPTPDPVPQQAQGDSRLVVVWSGTTSTSTRKKKGLIACSAPRLALPSPLSHPRTHTPTLLSGAPFFAAAARLHLNDIPGGGF